MVDYSVLYRTQLQANTDWSTHRWDVFISAYNSSDRVITVFRQAVADHKHWLLFPEYQYEEDEYPGETVYALGTDNEAEFILGYLRQFELDSNWRICIDITGFLKPYAMFLVSALFAQGFRRFDVLYSEPSFYAKKEETQFSDERVRIVRQVAGFEGAHDPDTSKDLLIINAGYDHELIKQIAMLKDHARKAQIFGFPSLQADMYQGNVLRAQRAHEQVGVHAGNHPDNYFAPANDPFVTASVLRNIVNEEQARHGISNLYLCPLATEVQALGFTLYYLMECQGKAVSMVYPFCHSYPRSTSEGLSRTWKYTVEFPEFNIGC